MAKHVVRIEKGDGKILGSGFFVAPGWALTCAHVVADLDDVELLPVAGGERLLAHVEARSTPPPPGWQSNLRPFPDLALLSFAGGRGHHCALLATAQPGQVYDCHTWGYARRETGVEPVGSPASFSFQGVEGDGFFALKADVVRPGISGGPLVCPDRRAVTGVMTGTRDPRAPLGGWAAPISALRHVGPGVPDVLSRWERASWR